LTSVNFETVLADMVARYSVLVPDLAENIQLESDPVRKLLEIVAYEKVLFNSRVNHSAQAVMIAFAQGSDLDHLAALIPLEREEGETDDSFRARVHLAPEGFSTAGPIGGYKFFASEADPAVLDVFVDTFTPERVGDEDPARGDVHVYVLGSTTGELPDAVRTKVEASLNDGVRPLTDHVTVKAPAVREYSITGAIRLGPGPDAETVRFAAEAAANAYAADNLELGGYITRAGITAAVFIGGVLNFTLEEPFEDIQADPREVLVCKSVNITLENEGGGG
jgi:phage-related baseplate assembly protein